MRDQARLTGIADNRPITPASAPQFWYACQRSILLARREEGLLSESRQGEAALRARRPAGPEGGRL